MPQLRADGRAWCKTRASRLLTGGVMAGKGEPVAETPQSSSGSHHSGGAHCRWLSGLLMTLVVTVPGIVIVILVIVPVLPRPEEHGVGFP